MSMSDPISDFLTRIRNGIMANNTKVEIVKQDVLISTMPITLLGNALGVKSKLRFRGIASAYIGLETKKINWPKP